MKKYLLLLIGLVFACQIQAEINIKSGSKYYFVCKAQSSGNMVVGAYHGQAAYIYHTSNSSLSDDSYWTIVGDENGYTIQNAVTREYIIYKEGRVQNSSGQYQAKGLQLSATTSGNNGLWKFSENTDGTVIITSVEAPSQGFNLRLDGTGLVGTYSVSGSSNECFMVYDQYGMSITGTSGGGGGTVTPDKPETSDDYGMTADGQYWETVGLGNPIVLTTDTKNPIYYRIQNVRSSKWVYVYANNLYQDIKSSTRFYFMKDGDGIKVYTEGGQYVSTSFLAFGEGQSPLITTTGSASGKNIWDIEFYEHDSYPGYALFKLDNLPTTAEGYSQSQYLYWNDYNVSGGVIGLYNRDSGSTFKFYSSDQRHIDNLKAQGLFGSGAVSEGTVSSYVDTLRINNKDLIYDKKEKVYYCALPSSARGENSFLGTLTASCHQKDKGYIVYIDDTAANEDGEIDLGDIDCTKDYEITIKDADGQRVASSPLRFTYMPIVEVTYNYCNGSYYNSGTIRVTDPNTAGYDSTYIAAYKYRGATAQNYDKKSYAIKLRDEKGESVDREFFGLRDDNNWILDAMAIDKACMRNRVSTDLWNDFATHPYHRREGWEKKARQGTRGEFVEVFLNGTYHGLYCMTEKMDRKQLKLKKYVEQTNTTAAEIHGVLYKSAQWGYEVFMGHESDSQYFSGTTPKSYSNNSYSESWANYEVKYPDYETEKIDWGPLWNCVNFVATSSDNTFIKDFDKYLDAPTLDDYYLFIELMLATDNHGKNLFFYCYDKLGDKYSSRIGFAPWDLDGTWGRRWDGSNYLTHSRQDFTNFLWQYEHGTHTIFHRLQNIKNTGWAERLATRYAELRPTHFDPENLKDRFTAYCDLFVESGADLREQKKWNSLHNDIAGDVEYIHNWIDERVEFLDRQYNFDPITVGVNEVEDTKFFDAVGGNSCISINTSTAQTLHIYSVSGALVRTVDAGIGQTIVDHLEKGVYVVGNQKVIVK